MHTNVNLAAPLGVIALLGTGFLLLAAAAVLVQALIVRHQRRSGLTAITMIVIAAVYVAVLLAFSFAGRGAVLARGEEKHFCEIDCHLAYSIVGVRQSKTLGVAPNQLSARGIFTVITIKTRFDETTIGANRGNGLLYPDSRVLTLVDEHGAKYTPIDAGAAQQVGTPLTTPLRPSEAYTTDLIFDLPTGLKSATLLINEGDWITHLIIGHENSPLHGKTAFKIEV